jgi:hypothetical protein
MATVKIVELAKPPWPTNDWTPPPSVSQDIGGGVVATTEADPNRLRLTLSVAEEKEQPKKQDELL